jgi:hypothetical protein
MTKIIIDDKVWKELTRKLRGLVMKSVEVGVLASKGGNDDHGGITNSELAAIHEFGAPEANIPRRSFLHDTFNDSSNQREQAKLSARLSKNIINGESIDSALDRLGEWGKKKVKKRITGEGVPPPLKPATIARKGSNTALVDTGQLLDAIDYEVK